MKISLPVCTHLHECLHYQSGISSTPVVLFNVNYQGLQMDSLRCISSQLPAVCCEQDSGTSKALSGLSVCTLVGALCRVSRTRSEAVMLKACKELCRRHPGVFGTWRDTTWWQWVLQRCRASWPCLTALMELCTAVPNMPTGNTGNWPREDSGMQHCSVTGTAAHIHL